MGAGRSGTSTVAGVVAGAGYFMGDDLHAPRTANPKGFFEGPLVKAINEDLLAPVVPIAPPAPAVSSIANAPAGSRWLARVTPGTPVVATPEIAARISAAIARAPLAYKDPRFCYTLNAWRPLLPDDTVFVCVFREPTRTVNSTLKERREAPYLRYVHLTYASALELWTVMYRHVARRA